MFKFNKIICKGARNKKKEGFLAKSDDIVIVDKHLVRLSSPSEHTRPGVLIKVKTSDNISNKVANR